jgi:hypothetical protein
MRFGRGRWCLCRGPLQLYNRTSFALGSTSA